MSLVPLRIQESPRPSLVAGRWVKILLEKPLLLGRYRLSTEHPVLSWWGLFLNSFCYIFLGLKKITGQIIEHDPQIGGHLERKQPVYRLCATSPLLTNTFIAVCSAFCISLCIWCKGGFAVHFSLFFLYSQWIQHYFWKSLPFPHWITLAALYRHLNIHS